MLPDNQTIIRGLRNKDKWICRSVYQHSFPVVRKYVLNHRGSETDAEDIFHMGMEAVFRQVRDGDFVIRCLFSTYFFAVCKKIWLKQLKTRSRRPELIGLDCAEEVEENECDQIGDVLISRIIDKHMARLDATCLKILTLFFSRHRLAEISEETGVGMNYIKLKKHICQRKLIEMVRKDPYIKELLE